MKALFLALLVCVSSDVAAVDGALDASFGTGGRVITAFPDFEALAGATVVQGDGHVLVAGGRYASNAYLSQFVIVRYAGSTGAVDASFGDNGVATMTVSTFGGAVGVSAVAVVTGGRIVIAGHFYDYAVGRDVAAIARFNSDGSPDTTFGANGLVELSIPGMHTGFSDMAIQPDGMVIAAGSAQYYTGNTILARFDETGALDASFGDAGVVQDQAYPFSSASSVMLQSDGSILTLQGGVACSTMLARYTSAGVLDTSFADKGSSISAMSNACVTGSVMALQGDKIVVAGADDEQGFFSASLARYNLTDGSLDTTFGKQGFVVTSLYDGSYAKAVGVQVDGKIVIATNGRDLVRYLPDGAIDESFGTKGLVEDSLGPQATYAGFTIQKDGKILATGYFDDNAHYVFATARFLSSAADRIFCGIFDSSTCVE